MTTKSTHPIVAGESVTIRPIQPADSMMEGEFVRNLSMLVGPDTARRGLGYVH